MQEGILETRRRRISISLRSPRYGVLLLTHAPSSSQCGRVYGISPIANSGLLGAPICRPSACLGVMRRRGKLIETFTFKFLFPLAYWIHHYNIDKMYSHTHTYVHTYIHTYVHTYIRTYICTYIHTYIRTYIHTYVHTYIHTYMHTYVHTYIHTYMQSSLLYTWRCKAGGTQILMQTVLIDY